MYLIPIGGLCHLSFYAMVGDSHTKAGVSDQGSLLGHTLRYKRQVKIVMVITMNSFNMSVMCCTALYHSYN
jgi:hypothetical protein